jgi:hypothetical protein
MGLGSGIGKKSPGSRGQKSTGLRIRNTAFNHSEDTSVKYTIDGEKKHNVPQLPSLTPMAKKIKVCDPPRYVQ